MSQRTRLKKMSLGAALILGTVSVSNFAEATENGSSTIPGIKSEANKGSVNEAGSQISDAPRSEGPPVSTGPSERVGGNASGNSARIRLANNLYRYVKGLTFGKLFEAAKSVLEIDIKSALSAQAQITRQQWEKAVLSIARGDYGEIKAKVFLEGMKLVNPEYAKKIQDKIAFEKNEVLVPENTQKETYEEIYEMYKRYVIKRNNATLKEYTESLEKVKNQQPFDKEASKKKLNDELKKITEEYLAKKAEIQEAYQEFLDNFKNQKTLDEQNKTLEKYREDLKKLANQEDLGRQAAKEEADVAEEESESPSSLGNATSERGEKVLTQGEIAEAEGLNEESNAEEIKESDSSKDESGNSSNKTVVANQEDLDMQAAAEKEYVAEEKRLRSKSLRARIDAEAKEAAEDLRQGKTAKAEIFYENSSEVIRQYYEGTSEEKAALKEMGYNNRIIRGLKALNKQDLSTIKGVLSEEKNSENQDNTENEAERVQTVEAGY